MVGHNQSTTGFIALRRVSYLFMGALLVLLSLLHLAVPFLAALFSYLALTRLMFFRRGGKWPAVLMFVALLGGIAYGLVVFINQTIRALPEIADKAIPSIIDTARQKGVELPFTDYDSLREFALDTVKGEVRYLVSAASFARRTATHLVLLLAGCIVAISIFFNPRFQTGPPVKNPGDLYSTACAEVTVRFQTFYQSFVTVMGAQVVISATNTVLTGIFVLATRLPYSVVVIGVTFLCGLLPIIGNLISNAIIVVIGFTVSPRMALGAFIFLVVIHKLEYVLNSKIVGARIRNPVWLTLVGLLVGERLMGIPGMILAPVVLNYIKLEASTINIARNSATELVPAYSTKDDA